MIVIGSKVVANDNSARLQLGGIDIADVGFKRPAIHCTADDPRSGQIVLGQPRNECLGYSNSKWCVHLQTASTQAMAIVAV